MQVLEEQNNILTGELNLAQDKINSSKASKKKVKISKIYFLFLLN